MDIFMNFGPVIADAVNRAVDDLVINYGDAFESFSNAMLRNNFV